MIATNRLHTVEVVLTSDCNQRCSYCYQDDKKPGRMGPEVLRAAIALLLRSRREQITLSFGGGEPLLEFDLIRESVSEATSNLAAGRTIRFRVGTNGLLLDDAVADFLARHRVDTRISFDGAVKAQDLRAPGSFPALDALLDRLRLRQRRFYETDLSIAVTVTASNLPYLAESVAYFIGKGVRRIDLAPVLSEPRWEPGAEREMDRQFERVFQMSLRHYRRTGLVPLSLLHKQGPGPPPSPRSCTANGGEALTVDVDGRVSTCALFARSFRNPLSLVGDRWNEQTGLGDVRDPSLEERLVRLSTTSGNPVPPCRVEERRSTHGPCRLCLHRGECFVCPGALGLGPTAADPRLVPDFHCAFNLTVLAMRERFPFQPAAPESVTGSPRVADSPRRALDLSNRTRGPNGPIQSDNSR